MGFKYEEIRDWKPISFKKLNDNFRNIWGRIDTFDNKPNKDIVSSNNHSSIIEQKPNYIKFTVKETKGENILLKDSFPVDRVDTFYGTFDEVREVYRLQATGGLVVLSTKADRKLNLKPNTDYTFCFYAAAEFGNQVVSVDLFPDTLPETSITIMQAPARYVWTFKTPNISDATNCDLRFYGNIANTIHITRAILVEGIKEDIEWTPNASELKSTIVTITSSGMTTNTI